MRRRSGKILLCIALLLMQLNLMHGSPPAFAAASAAAPKLVAGYYHTASLVSSGDVYVWGQGDRGQIGDAAWNARNTPVQARGLNDVMDIHTGVRSTMALRSDGTVWTWGSNENGQLGIGTTADKNVPTPVSGLSGIKAISGGLGYHSMALTENGTVWTWGKNDNGELGNGTTVQQNSPVLVIGLSDVTAIAAGGYYSLALKSDGTVWAWGANGNGELGDGTIVDKHTPVQVSGLTDVIAITAGGSHSLAIKQDGTVWAWGINMYGTLGDGTRTNRTIPVKVRNLQHIKAIAGGGHHSLALDQEGNVWGWGDNSRGQLGLGHNSSRTTPEQLTGIEHVLDIAGGGFHSAALKKDGRVWGWGLNSSGQIGDGTRNDRNAPALTKAVLDTTAPDTGRGMLSPYLITVDSIGIEWLGASDNLTEQDELQYLLYASHSPNIGTVSQIERNGIPIGSYAAGQLKVVADRLNEGSDYYFNVIVKDAVGNKSAYNMLKVATKWPQIYTLTYDGNENMAGNVPISGELFARGDEADIQDNTGQLTKDGYSFDGWNTQADGNGIDYPVGSKLVFGTENIRLYAKWNKNPDPVKLEAVSYAPAHQSAGVEMNETLTVTFNEEVTAVSGRSILLRDTSDQHITERIDVGDTDRVSVIGNTVVINPLTEFDYGRSYYVEIEPGAFTGSHSGRSYGGIQGEDTWSFTAKELTTPVYDTTLQELTLNSSVEAVNLSPAFSRFHNDYTAQVGNKTDRLTVTALVYDASVMVTASVYGETGGLEAGPIDIISGQESPDIPLAVGNSRIELAVTAPSGQHHKYVIHVTRAPSSGGGTTPEEPGGGGTPIEPGEGGGPGTPGGGSSPGSTGSGADSTGSSVPVESPGNRVNVRVTLNNKIQEGMVTGLFHEAEGHTVVSMKLDTAKLEARLKTVEYNPVIIIALAQPADHISLELSGTAMDQLKAKQGAIEIRSSLGTFHLPAEEVSSTRWRAPRGFDRTLAADQILVYVTIAASDAAKLRFIQQTAEQAGTRLVGSPVDFDITATANDFPLRLEQHKQYMEHRISLPLGMQNPITTAVRVSERGEFIPIPTRLEMKKDGSLEVVLHSFVTGTFAFIFNEIRFADVQHHWSGDAVNDLASRMILNGRGSGKDTTSMDQTEVVVQSFAPNAQVSRAEFAAMMVRALGLQEGQELSAFKDVSSDAWYSGVLALASRYDLLQGYEDGSFRPDQAITRQEAMVVMARVMELTGLNRVVDENEAVFVLSSYQDHDELSARVKPAAAALVKQGIVQGDAARLMPLQKLSRGEAAVMLQRLLKAAGLIDG